MKLATGYVLSILIACTAMSCDADDVHAAKMELRENWDELESYAIERREEVQNELGRAFDDLGDKLEQVDERLAEAKDSADEKTAQVVAELREQKAALGRRLEELRNAGADTWNEVKVDVIQAMRAFERSVADAWNRIVEG
jgi:DNA repair exonuclease SbcCD ATPase subunit